MATGGIGGIHRGYDRRLDISADLAELGRTPALVVCSGVKSLLDVPATLEALETFGVPVVGFGTDSVPLFYAAEGGPPAPIRADTVDEVARIARAHWELGGAAIVVARPPDPEIDVSQLIEEALGEAESQCVSGQAVTPFVLSRLHERSGGRTLEVNRRLAADNAALAAEIAAALGS
jgi:pseudouridine-5'-phosphate glycosidase